MGLYQNTVEAMGSLITGVVSIEDLTLEVVEGPHQGKSLRVDRDMIRIGREEWCDLSLPDDPWVSNVHCECWLDAKGLRVHDLNSRNGIKLGPTPVFDAYFLPEERLQVGQSVIALRSQKKRSEIAIPFHDETGTLVGKSRSMRKIFSLLSRLSKRKITTLLTGETGTGKTSIAQAIHLQHHGDDAPFVVVNCGALPPSLVESALFGHEKGSFTGADKQRKGYFEQADGGTLFLDEIAELPLDLQPKLLDVLERRKIRRLGSEQERSVDVHLITATHRDLHEESQLGRFREDLFFRLSVVELLVPPLRERKEDIPLLVEAFLLELSPDQPIYVTPEAMLKLKSELWPGNIRELRNCLERALVFLDGDTLEADDLALPRRDTSIAASSPKQAGPAATAGAYSGHPRELWGWMEDAFPAFPLSDHGAPIDLKEILKHTERFFIQQALDECDLNAPDAAKLLSLSESWLYSRIKRYGLTSRRKK